MSVPPADGTRADRESIIAPVPVPVLSVVVTATWVMTNKENCYVCNERSEFILPAGRRFR
jgi:hypothetical protein